MSEETCRKCGEPAWTRCIGEDSVPCLKRQLAAAERGKRIAERALELRLTWGLDKFSDWSCEHLEHPSDLAGFNTTVLAYALAEDELYPAD